MSGVGFLVYKIDTNTNFYRVKETLLLILSISKYLVSIYKQPLKKLNPLFPKILIIYIIKDL